MRPTTYYGNIKSSPRWAGDFMDRDHLEPWPAKIDASQFIDQGGIQIAMSASAAAGATNLAVTALALSPFAATTLISSGNTLMPAGTVINFSSGTGKFAKITADAHLGDTLLAVEAIPTIIVATDTASFSWWNGETIPSGSFVGRIYTNQGRFVPAQFTNHTEIRLVAFDIPNAHINDDVQFYRAGQSSVVYENYLPGYANFGSNQLNWLRANYKCVIGQD